MALADRLSQPAASYPRTPCSVGELVKTLPPDESTALKKALDSPFRIVGHDQIIAALQAEGHRFGHQMVGIHRRKQCSCFRGQS